MNRKFIIFSTITLFLFVGLFTFINISKQEVQLPSDVDVYTDETTGETVYELELDGTQDVDSRKNHLELDNEPIQRSMSWRQPSGYISYRISVDNNSAVPIKVTYGPDNLVMNVSGYSSNSSTVNNAASGVHNIDINNSDGSALKGLINVRVSDVPQ